MYDKKAKLIFDELIRRGILPKSGEFKITNDLLDASYLVGCELFGVATKNKAKPSNIRFHKRIAGLNFQHLLAERVNTSKKVVEVKNNTVKQTSGFLYIIENPSFPNHIKVGITKNLTKRLAQYQTYDPHRSFKVVASLYVEDVRKLEKEFISKFREKSLASGEWVPKSILPEIFKQIKCL